MFGHIPSQYVIRRSEKESWWLKEHDADINACKWVSSITKAKAFKDKEECEKYNVEHFSSRNTTVDTRTFNPYAAYAVYGYGH